MGIYRKEKQKKINWFSKLAIYIFVFGGFFACFSALPASAASYYFSPASGSFRLGQTFSVSVYASSKDQAANAFQGTINFPENLLQVTSLSKSGSALSMWIVEPQFSNGAGTVQFEGVIMNPGYTGSGARILTVNFKVKALGTANLSFTAATILANDGLGTNILEGLGTATYNLNAAPVGNEAGASTSGSAKAGTPLPPEIKSFTHPSPDVWYNIASPQIYWQLSPDITGVSYSFTKDIASDPGTKSVGLATAKTYNNISDGDWYFHIRLQNKQGWGATGHRRFKIDTKPPENFKISFPVQEKPENPRPPIVAFATDALSGVDHYELVVGEITLTNIKPVEIAEKTPYLLPSQEPGSHNVLAKVYDAAGNNAVTLGEFNVAALKPPVIITYPEKLLEDEVMTVGGKTYPSSEVSVSFQRDDGGSVSQVVTSNNLGEFSLTAAEKVKRGIYKVWATVKDDRGAVSKPSDKIVVPVNARVARLLGEKTLMILSWLVQFAGLLALIIILISYMKRKIQTYRERVVKDVEETKDKVDVVLAKLKQNEGNLIEMLEKAKLSRQLTPEEDEVLTRLGYESQGVAPAIDKDMDDLEADVKK